MQEYKPYVTDIPGLWAKDREGYPRSALWTNGKELYSYGLMIGDTLGGKKRLWAYTRGDGTGDKYRSMTTSQHIGMCRQWADIIMVWNGANWVTQEAYERGTLEAPLLMVEYLNPDQLHITRGDVDVLVTIYEKLPHGGHIRISLGPNSTARTYPVRPIE